MIMLWKMVEMLLLGFFVLLNVAILSQANHHATTGILVNKVYAASKDKCFKAAFVKMEDLTMYDSVEEMPDKHLCFFKCLNEEVGVFNKRGDIRLSKLKELFVSIDMSEDTFEDLVDCFRTVPSVKICDDMKYVQECLYKFIEKKP